MMVMLDVVMLAWGSGLSGAGDPSVVSGGIEVATCGWPTVVRMASNCSGTLIHPQVVVYAGHCGAAQAQVTLGEVEAQGTSLATEQCWQNPDWTGSPGGTDFAVCRLAEPVTNIPIVPIMMGCETQLLLPDVEVTSVGFGNAPDGPNGIKRALSYPIVGVDWEDGELGAGGGEATLCSGDSGGGTFARGLDGSWRLVGVNSAVAGEPCVSGAALIGMLAGVVPWIEEQTGFDVSPCYAADGSWEPDERCAQIPNDPATGGGAWPACEYGTLSGSLSTCGVPFVGEDLVAPSVAISTPVDGTTYELDDQGSASIAVALQVDDADGFGVARTRLQIDGADVPGSEDDWTPFEVPGLTFSAGTYTLQAVATDWAGNEAMSSTVTVVVGPTSSDEGSSTDDGEVSSGGGGDDTDTGGTSDDPESSGMSGSTQDGVAGDGTGSGNPSEDGESASCSVHTRRRVPVAGWALAIVLWRRRRA